MTDQEFLSQLEACTLPPGQFHHADHLRAAWLYLTRHSAGEAIQRFSQTLRRYTSALGKAGRYHETITWAYLLLINERLAQHTAPVTWERFTAANADLFAWNPSILAKYYKPETLESPLARSIFLMPDLLR